MSWFYALAWYYSIPIAVLLFLAVLLLGYAVIGYAIALFSSSKKTRVQIGRRRPPEQHDAWTMAPRYVPYAILATRAYEPLDASNQCPPLTVNDRKLPQEALDLLRDGWECIYAHAGPWPCPAGANFSRVADGLGVQIWQSKPKDGICSEFVIAFRGTDTLVDMISNGRWVWHRFLRIYDQYHQVRLNIEDRVDWIKARATYRESSRIIAVGHSLGGGLAQQAAYACDDIHSVYAFDPTPVTGFYDVDETARCRNAKGIRIDRIYESGEVLFLLRWGLARAYAVTEVDPEIYDVRFNYTRGGFVSQHSMAAFAENLMRTPAPAVTAVPGERLPAG